MSVNRLVVFFIPPSKIVNGGIMSIFSLCKESRAFLTSKDLSVVSVFPGTKSYRNNDLFENSEYIYEFTELLKKYPETQSILLHIPEYAIKDVSRELPNYIPPTIKVSINVLNQNIDMMPTVGDFANLLISSSEITQTTAHAKYATKELASKYATPLMHLSVFIDPEQYKKVAYPNKDKVILYSPDGYESKDSILTTLHQALPDYKIKEIKDLTYAEYKKAIQKARYVITFGEGLDGYLIESCFSGSVAMSVFNERFFPSKDFAEVGGIYKNYKEMAKKIASDISSMDTDPALYSKHQSDMEVLLKAIYDKSIYLKNLKRFYASKFNFIPTQDDRDNFIAMALSEKNQFLDDWKNANSRKDSEIEALKTSNQEYATLYESAHDTLRSIQNSLLWKATTPLRKATKLTKRSRNPRA